MARAYNANYSKLCEYTSANGMPIPTLDGYLTFLARAVENGLFRIEEFPARRGARDYRIFHWTAEDLTGLADLIGCNAEQRKAMETYETDPAGVLNCPVHLRRLQKDTRKTLATLYMFTKGQPFSSTDPETGQTTLHSSATFDMVNTFAQEEGLTFSSSEQGYSKILRRFLDIGVLRLTLLSGDIVLRSRYLVYTWNCSESALRRLLGKIPFEINNVELVIDADDQPAGSLLEVAAPVPEVDTDTLTALSIDRESAVLNEEKKQLLERLAAIDQRQAEIVQEKEEERRKDIARKEEEKREAHVAYQTLEAIAQRQGFTVEEFMQQCKQQV